MSATTDRMASFSNTLHMPDRRVLCATCVEDARPGRGEDRIATLVLPDRTVIVVADGAGGVGGGAAAAEAVCRSLDETARTLSAWDAWLAKQDRVLAASASGGLAAAVILEIRHDGAIRGASVGDCEAWIFTEGDARCLTERQIRKPLLGGGARPVPFVAHLSRGTLVVGTDGLWKYAAHGRIAEAAAHRPLDLSAAALIESVRLRSGALQDDVGVAVFEIKL